MKTIIYPKSCKLCCEDIYNGKMVEFVKNKIYVCEACCRKLAEPKVVLIDVERF